jgi:hypothetical protein
MKLGPVGNGNEGLSLMTPAKNQLNWSNQWINRYDELTGLYPGSGPPAGDPNPNPNPAWKRGREGPKDRFGYEGFGSSDCHDLISNQSVYMYIDEAYHSKELCNG